MILPRDIQIFREDSINDLNDNIKNRIKELINLYESPLDDIEIIYEDKDTFYSRPYIEDKVYGFYNPALDNNVHMIVKECFPEEECKFGTYDMLIIHECMHAILDSIDCQCSIELQEGIACYESGQIHIFDGKPFKAKNIYIKYGRLVRDIIQEGGYEKLLRIIHAEELEPLPREKGIDESYTWR